MYVWADINGSVACACAPTSDICSLTYLDSDDEVRAHLDAHIAAGHVVPEGLIDDIIADVADDGGWGSWRE